jgi:hypothetical protein
VRGRPNRRNPNLWRSNQKRERRASHQDQKEAANGRELWSNGMPLSMAGWNAIRLLGPAFSRLRTFLWFATAVAGLTVRTELLGVTNNPLVNDQPLSWWNLDAHRGHANRPNWKSLSGDPDCCSVRLLSNRCRSPVGSAEAQSQLW